MRAWLLALALAWAAPGAAWAQDCRRAVPIQFAAGSSSGSVEGAVIRGERACYSVTARAGQMMRVEVKSVEDNAVFQIYQPGWRLGRDSYGVTVAGRSLPRAGEGEDARIWSGPLPLDGAQLIVLGGTRGNANYRLTVTIR